MDYSRIVERINSENCHVPLVLAWHLRSVEGNKVCFKAGAAKITSIENNGFSLTINGGSTASYKIDPPFVSPSEARERILKLSETCLIVPFPNVPLTYITILLWIALIFVCMVDPASSGQSMVMIRDYLMMIFRTEHFAACLLAGLIIIHFIEAMFVLYLLKSIRSPSFSIADLNTWASMTLLLGFPCSLKAYFLSNIAKVKGVKSD